jgi:hypothetical protein
MSITANRTGDHEQKDPARWFDTIPIRASCRLGQSPHPFASPILNAPVSFRVVIQHVLRGDAAEWCYSAGTTRHERGLSLAARRYTSDALPEFGSGGNLVQWYIFLKSVSLTLKASTL